MLNVYIIAGPNGSGKTTFAKEFVKKKELYFLNADEIAATLNPNDYNAVKLKAGQLFFRKFYDLVSLKESFVLETTLSGNYLVKLIKILKQKKYKVILIYIFINTIEESIDRIKIRVKKGGHHIPDDDVKRRFKRSKNNFFNKYKDLVNWWEIYYNGRDQFMHVAHGENKDLNIINEHLFQVFKEDF
jgi:predicted ABC-type ATPase